MNKLQKLRKSENGFTLVELLVVILIIGILIAIAVPAFLSQTDNASNTEPQVNLRNAYSAAVSARSNNGGAFPTGADLAASVAALSTEMDEVGEAAISDKMVAMPADENTMTAGNVYVVSVTGNTIVLRAVSSTGDDYCASSGTGGAAQSGSACAA